jgi:hypothetical protein
VHVLRVEGFVTEWYHDQPTRLTAQPVAIVAGQVTVVDEQLARA